MLLVRGGDTHSGLTRVSRLPVDRMNQLYGSGLCGGFPASMLCLRIETEANIDHWDPFLALHVRLTRN